MFVCTGKRQNVHYFLRFYPLINKRKIPLELSFPSKNRMIANSYFLRTGIFIYLVNIQKIFETLDLSNLKNTHTHTKNGCSKILHKRKITASGYEQDSDR